MADTPAEGQLGRERTPLVYAERNDAAGVAAALAEQIARLKREGRMSFKEAMNRPSRREGSAFALHLPELVVAVGAAGVALVEAAFPGEAEEARKCAGVALRGIHARAGGTARHSQGAGGEAAAANRRQGEMPWADA